MENKHDFSFPVSWNGYILGTDIHIYTGKS